MTIAHAIEYPALGISYNRNGYKYLFPATCKDELSTCRLHQYVRSIRHQLFFLDSSGNIYKATGLNLVGLDWEFIKQVGFIASLISSFFSLFNIPVSFSFKLIYQGPCDLDEVRSLMRECIYYKPAFYTFNRDIAKIISDLTRASDAQGLIRSVLN